MGGASSCGLALGAASKSVKVIDGKGRAHEFLYGAIRAAELMAESPGHFVCDSTNLQVGCRVPGIAADEELLQSRLYFLLPTDLLFSVLTEEEMAWLLRRVAGATAVRRRRRRRRRSKVSFIKTGVDEERKKAEEAGRRCGGVLAMERLRRSWEPALDTIEEEGIEI